MLTLRIVSKHQTNTRSWKLREFSDEYSRTDMKCHRIYIPEKINTNGKLQVNDLLQLGYTSYLVFSTLASQIDLI